MTELDFAGKIDWEGGPFAALEYGLSGTELEEEGELLNAWVAFEGEPNLHNSRRVEAAMDAVWEKHGV